MEAAANAVAHGLETPARVGAQAYQAIPGAVEKAGNALLTPAAKLVTAGIKLPDIEKTKRELQAAVQAGRTEDAARLQAQLERETTKVSHGALGRIYRMRKQGEGAGTQFMNAVRSNPYARRGLTQQSVRGVEGADNIAHNYVRELAQQEDDVAARNEQAIYDAEQAAIAKRDALLAQGNRKAADAVKACYRRKYSSSIIVWAGYVASGPVRKEMEDAKVYEPTQWERENIPSSARWLHTKRTTYRTTPSWKAARRASCSRVRSDRPHIGSIQALKASTPRTSQNRWATFP